VLFIISIGATASADVLTVTVTKGTLKAFNFTVNTKAKAEPAGITAAVNPGTDSVTFNGFDVTGVKAGETVELMKFDGSINLDDITVNSLSEGCEVTFGTK
jgi:hypothetical protein